MGSKSPIPITDILSLCQIPYPNKASFNIPCPICDGARNDSRHKHMNVRIDGDVFRCPKCSTKCSTAAYTSTSKWAASRKCGKQNRIIAQRNLYGDFFV